MSYQGNVVIDMDSHIREYADMDRVYRGHVDPEYRESYERLSRAVASRQRWPGEQVLFRKPRGIVGPVPERRPLGVYDALEEPPSALPAGRASEIDRAVNWDPAIRLRDMDTAQIDTSVMFSSQSDGFCKLRDVGFEHALQRAYNRYASDYCSEADGRLRWVANSTIRDPRASAEEMTHWAANDKNFAGMFIPRACPDGRLLDNPDLYPFFRCAEELNLPILVHGGTMRPPLTPGATDLDNAGFIIDAVYHAWAGETALSALIGGGVLDLFPKLRIGIFESGAGWMPWLVERLDESYRPSSGMTPNLKRKPSEVVAEGRIFCAVDPGEKYLEFCTEEFGDDIWLFGTDYPHPGTPWPDGVAQIVDRKGLSDSAKIKILGGNAKRFLPHQP